MTGWIVALAVLAALWLLGRIRLGVRAVYEGGQAQVRLLAGPVRAVLYPRKERGGRPEREKKPKQGRPARAEREKTPRPMPPLGQLLELGCQAAGALRRKIRVDELTVHITWAGADPAQTAIGFGRANAALGMIWPMIDHNFRVKKHDLGVAVDFEGARPAYEVRAAVTLTVSQLLAFGLRFGGKLLILWSRGRRAPEMRQEASV